MANENRFAKPDRIPGHVAQPSTDVPRDGLGGAKPMGAKDGASDKGKFEGKAVKGINK